MRRADWLKRPIPASVVWWLVIVLLVLVGQWMQSRVHLNHDVSYFVHFAGWLLQGRALGSDLFDGNLPMAWALFMPAATLVHWGMVDEATAVQAVFWCYFLLSTALLVRVLSRPGALHRPAAAGWIAAFVAMATLTPGFSFGQREHACVLFAMPYLAAAASRLQRGPGPGKVLAVGIGLMAGVAFALKPHFLAVPAVIELLLLARLGWRALPGRIESLVLGLTVLAYGLAAALLLRNYLEFTIDLTLSTYWAYDTVNFPVVIERYLRAAQPVLYGSAIAVATRTWSAHHTVMLMAGLGFAASYFVQSKGFVYHAYPVLVVAMTFLGICVGHGLAGAVARWREAQSPLRLSVVVLAAVLALPSLKQAHDGVVRWYFTYNKAWGTTGRFRQAVIDVVNRLAPTDGEYFFAFTTHPFPGFPTASYTLAEWSGRSIVQSLIPAYARIDEVADPAIRAGVLRAADYQRKMVVEDFLRRPPVVVFAERNRMRLGMNGRPFDDIAFYSEDPRFRQIWKRYEEYPPLGSLRVFIRREAGQAR